jgi:hypothetical protein
MIKVSINITYLSNLTLLQYFITLSLASGNLSHLRSNAVCCCNSIITGFHHEHFSVLLRKGKDCYAFYIFINVTHFVLQSMQDPHGHPWVNAGFHPWQKRDFQKHSTPSLSSRRTLIQLHYFSASYAATHQLFLLHWRVGSLQLLWHTCSHSPRDYGQLPDNWVIDLFS